MTLRGTLSVLAGAVVNLVTFRNQDEFIFTEQHSLVGKSNAFGEMKTADLPDNPSSLSPDKSNFFFHESDVYCGYLMVIVLIVILKYFFRHTLFPIMLCLSLILSYQSYIAFH